MENIQKEVIAPDYRTIYSDIILKKYPDKIAECKILLTKEELSSLDIVELNKKIFGTGKEAEQINQKYRSYSKSDILRILNYQKKNRLNNIELANHFKLSRNTVAKWKKIWL